MAEGIVGEFLALKSETDADLLAMQCGDFYEFFADDAETVAAELDLKVSQKSSHGSSYPMAGVPVDDLTPHLKALVERGYRVAVADQYETDDGHAREITRVVTPGTLLDRTDATARYIAAIARGESRYGLGFADVTTGRFLVTTVESADAAGDECHRFDPVEVLPGPDVRTDDDLLARLRDRTDGTVTLHDTEAFAPGRARRAVDEQFGPGTLASIGLDDEDGPAIRAAGAILAYVDDTGAGVLPAMTRLETYSPDATLALDATTQRNLELVETMEGDRSGSLIDTIDHTVTAAGGRLLREWITRPRRDRETLERRLDCVAALASAPLARDRVRDLLEGTADLARLAGRATGERADATDLLAVRDALGVLPDLEDAITGSTLGDSPLGEVVRRPDRDAATRLRDEIDAALVEDPPSTVTDGELFCRGYDDELDEVIERHETLREWFEDLADREKSRLGIAHLQVDRNKTDGYYIQVGKSETEKVPEKYREIKTLKNSRRYTTDDLDEREREILRLEDARSELEYEFFCELRDRVAARAELLQDVGRALAEVDALTSLAVHAGANDWTRPTLEDSNRLHVREGRHPVVETTTEFVPNDLRLDRDRQFLIVTGPNMSGKSTYMRQAALITLLAQVGSFVPAREATVGTVDGIYTRVGALDELAEGRSTFMVEMQELSNILHSATEDSLVVLDEVGRGTATYDGISIAWAATEYLSRGVDATASPKVLFATHYHELTALADRIDGVKNVHMAADERDGDVTFLRTVRPGAADRSYGIHVAELAGVPDPIVERAREILRKLRAEEAIEVRGSSDDGATTGDGSDDGDETTRQVVFDLGSGQLRSREDASADGGTTGGDVDPAVKAVVDELAETDVNEIPPVELMARVQEWQRRLDGRSD